ERGLSERNRLAILEDEISRDDGSCILLALTASLRRLDDSPIFSRHSDLRAGHLLDLACAAQVIRMRMRDEDILDIGRIETQCANAVQDGIGGVSVSRVYEEQPSVCSNMISANSQVIDIIIIVDTLDRYI